MPCVLDLSADTIDHNILITGLSSWFGIHVSVLCWFKSYLSSRSFRVKCDNNGPLVLSYFLLRCSHVAVCNSLLITTVLAERQALQCIAVCCAIMRHEGGEPRGDVLSSDDD